MTGALQGYVSVVNQTYCTFSISELYGNLNIDSKFFKTRFIKKDLD